MRLPAEERDKIEAQRLLDLLENEIIPMYYENPSEWVKVMKASMRDVVPFFDAGRMADEYYQKLYHHEASESEAANDNSNQYAA